MFLSTTSNINLNFQKLTIPSQKIKSEFIPCFFSTQPQHKSSRSNNEKIVVSNKITAKKRNNSK